MEEHKYTFQGIEFMMRFKELDKISNHGVYIQDQKQIGSMNNVLFSNVFACYRRMLLIDNPFNYMEGGEEIFQSIDIFKKNYIRIYDGRCVVRHSHNLAFHEYLIKQYEEMRVLKQVKIAKNINIGNKIRFILFMKVSNLKKCILTIQLFFFYLLKLIIFLFI